MQRWLCVFAKSEFIAREVCCGKKSEIALSTKRGLLLSIIKLDVSVGKWGTCHSLWQILCSRHNDIYIVPVPLALK